MIVDSIGNSDVRDDMNQRTLTSGQPQDSFLVLPETPASDLCSIGPPQHYREKGLRGVERRP